MYKRFFESIKDSYVKGKKQPINLNKLRKDNMTDKVIEYEPGPIKLNEKESTILANNLFNYVNFGLEPNDLLENIELKKEISKYATRSEQLLRSIELIPEPSTEKEFEIVAVAYFYLGAKFRLKSLEMYLIKKEKFGLFGMEILNFAQILEREYFFEEAKAQYLEMIKGNPMFQGYYVSVSTILRKQNKLDEAIYFLKQSQKLEYYKPYKSEYSPTGYNDDFKNVIDRNLEELINMKKRGYVYTPRNSKNKINE